MAPSIAYITKFINISEALGAVTLLGMKLKLILLAFANGAGDVVTAFVGKINKH